MANLSTYLRSGTPRPASIHGPGSNGFLKRAVFSAPGTFIWTAEKAGAIKIQAIGAAAGAYQNFPGCSGAYGEKRLVLLKGETLTVVVGAGSFGQQNGTPANAGTTSISGSAIGGTALSLVGALGARDARSEGGPGVPTGPWDASFSGARPVAVATGGTCSASPFGVGRAQVSGDRGGAGWSGFRARKSNGQLDPDAGQPSVVSPSRRLVLSKDPYEDFWDLAFAESAGGSGPFTYAATPFVVLGEMSGVGAGGGAGYAPSNGSGTVGLPSVVGGGTGLPQNIPIPKSGHGAGGAPWREANHLGGGEGGDGIVLIFWDEVAA